MVPQYGRTDPSRLPGERVNALMSPARLITRIATLPRGVAAWRLAGWRQTASRILADEHRYRQLSDDALRTRSLALGYRARSGEPLDRLAAEGFGLVREAAGRHLGMRHYAVQLVGGLAMTSGRIAEMQTGEGKTLTATLPLYLHALAGQGAHLATANDYLARRDGEWMQPVYAALGLSLGIVQSGQSSTERREAYASSITYGTAREFGFDFLRDRLLNRENNAELNSILYGTSQLAGSGSSVGIRTHFALIDEADSILIDEARTPLIISALSPAEADTEAACYAWAADMADRFLLVDHVEHDPQRHQYQLTASGRRLVHTLPKPAALNSVGQLMLYEFVERAIRVLHDFQRDRHYIVRDDEIVIVDEFTGRLAEGRKWRAGLHQAVEAREGLRPSVQTGQAARVTVQELFREYAHFAGMTGTAQSAAAEFRRVYGTAVSVIPTAFRKQRIHLPDRVLPDNRSRIEAIVVEVQNMLGRTDRESYTRCRELFPGCCRAEGTGGMPLPNATSLPGGAGPIAPGTYGADALKDILQGKRPTPIKPAPAPTGGSK